MNAETKECFLHILILILMLININILVCQHRSAFAFILSVFLATFGFVLFLFTWFSFLQPENPQKETERQDSFY